MPINSFESYPMSWKPNKKALTYPLYSSLANLLEQAIVNGDLAPNVQLPPQRELADFLDINLSTVTRAFKICEAKGLIYGTVGKGTFVSSNASFAHSPPPDSEGRIELGAIRPYYQLNTVVTNVARDVMNRWGVEKFFTFDSANDDKRYRKTGKKWLANFQVDAEPERIVLTAGTQNALTISLLALFKPGDKILTDSYTYPNFISLARQLSIQLVAVCGDAHGMLPELLDKQCRLTNAKGIYFMPSCSNPTGITIPPKRRDELARIIKKRRLIILEDDAYSFVQESASPIPFVSLLPDQTVYCHSLSKSVSAGMRIGYMVCPHALYPAISGTLNNISLKIPRLNAEIIYELIESGAAAKIIRQKRKWAHERNSVYAKVFPANVSSRCSFFQWLSLPESGNGYQFEAQACDHGVNVLCSERFVVGDTINQSAIRIATCSPYSLEDLEKGLLVLKKIRADNDLRQSSNKFIV